MAMQKPNSKNKMTPAELKKFKEAHRDYYKQAKREVRQGLKQTCWIWFIFPQLKGLGRSYNSEFYGLEGIGEAEAYIKHPILAARLREICRALLENTDKEIKYIMGWNVDVMKLKSSMELFNLVSPNDVFDEVLRAFFPLNV